MDWIKVKVSHALYEYTDLSDAQFRAWIRIMCLVAIMEKIPNEDEIERQINSRTLKTLREKLILHRTPLELILKKVLEDVEYTKHLKAKNRSRIAEYRHKKALCNTLPVTVTERVTLQGKIREDKIREDNTDVVKYFDIFCSLYPKPVNISVAYIQFKLSIKDEKDFNDLKVALSNYKDSNEVKKNFIKNADTWIVEWREWLKVKLSTKKVVPV